MVCPKCGNKTFFAPRRCKKCEYDFIYRMTTEIWSIFQKMPEEEKSYFLQLKDDQRASYIELTRDQKDKILKMTIMEKIDYWKSSNEEKTELWKAPGLNQKEESSESSNVEVMYHPINKSKEEVESGYSLPCLFFGCFWLFYKGLWAMAAITFLEAIILFFLFGLKIGILLGDCKRFGPRLI